MEVFVGCTAAAARRGQRRRARRRGGGTGRTQACLPRAPALHADVAGAATAAIRLVVSLVTGNTT